MILPEIRKICMPGIMSQTRPSARQQLENLRDTLPYIILRLSALLCFMIHSSGKTSLMIFRHWFLSEARKAGNYTNDIAQGGYSPFFVVELFKLHFSPRFSSPSKSVEIRCRMLGPPLYSCTGPLVLAYKT